MIETQKYSQLLTENKKLKELVRHLRGILRLDDWDESKEARDYQMGYDAFTESLIEECRV